MAEDSLDRIIESLAQINVTLESLRVSLGILTETRIDHEQRLRLMERWQARLSPVLAFLTFILGGAATAALQKWL
jgi:hypothetical protein